MQVPTQNIMESIGNPIKKDLQAESHATVVRDHVNAFVNRFSNNSIAIHLSKI